MSKEEIRLVIPFPEIREQEWLSENGCDPFTDHVTLVRIQCFVDFRPSPPGELSRTTFKADSASTCPNEDRHLSSSTIIADDGVCCEEELWYGNCIRGVLIVVALECLMALCIYAVWSL